MKWKKFVEYGEKNRRNEKWLEDYNGQEYFDLHYKGLFLIFEPVVQQYHDDESCDEDGLVLYEQDCSCNKEVIYNIYITNKNTKSRIFRSRLFSLDFTKNHTLEQVLLEYKNLPEVIDICQCGEKAEKDKWCSDCYIWRTEHPTDSHCSICHENEGQYVVTECGHYFHNHCWRKLEFVKGSIKKKCPLCRKVADDQPYLD